MAGRTNNPQSSGTKGAVSAHSKAQILAEALPYLQRYDNQTVVIKFGGHAMGDAALADAFAQDIVYLKLASLVEGAGIATERLWGR